MMLINLMKTKITSLAKDQDRNQDFSCISRLLVAKQDVKSAA